MATITAAITEAAIIDRGSAVSLAFDDGRRLRFHAVWLRDNALDSATRAPGNGQKLIGVLDISPDLRIAEAGVEAGDLVLRFAPGDARTRFPAAWLAAHAYDRPAETRPPGWTGPSLDLWDAGLGGRIPAAAFAEIEADRAALGRWLGAVRRYGFALLTGVPRRSGAVADVAGLFGHVRETNYGRWFDVRAEAAPSNLAYTDRGLQVHTDNPYRDPVPTLQLLACLENAAAGGESVVVDGFAVARRLAAEDPDAFRCLARYPARFAYAPVARDGVAGVRLGARRPMLELGPDGELIAVRFNNRSMAPLCDVPFDAMDGYYAAYRRFAALLGDPAFEVRFTLAPGDLFVVDNTRVLHGRTGFAGAGRRWLQGCYADKDGLLSTLATIETEMGCP